MLNTLIEIPLKAPHGPPLDLGLNKSNDLGDSLIADHAYFSFCIGELVSAVEMKLSAEVVSNCR
jgi:hypothetical protein